MSEWFPVNVGLRQAVLGIIAISILFSFYRTHFFSFSLSIYRYRDIFFSKNSDNR